VGWECTIGANIQRKEVNMMEEKVSNNIADEVKNNLIDFYHLHKEECDQKYLDATSDLNIYRDINDIQLINSYFIKTSVVILTANTFEKNILHLNAVRQKKQKIVHFIVDSYDNPQRPFNINIYFFRIGEFQILHLEAKQTGSYSMGGSADLIRFIMRNNYCFPSAVISYGICFGNDYKDQRIGDTIIVDKLYPYFMSAKVKEKYLFVKDTNIFDIDARLDAKIRYLIGKGKLSEKNRIFYGSMVTGEAVISNEIMKEIFIKAATNQPVLGGEMEGYGLFKECQGFERLIPCLIVKSICDWGAYKNIDDEDISEENLKDKLQAYAANKAYEVLTILLKKEHKVFDLSIYEQIKRKIFNSDLMDEGILHYDLLENILNKHVKVPELDKNIDFLCKMILRELEREGLICNIGKGVYRLKGDK